MVCPTVIFKLRACILYDRVSPRKEINKIFLATKMMCFLISWYVSKSVRSKVQFRFGVKFCSVCLVIYTEIIETNDLAFSRCFGVARLS